MTQKNDKSLPSFAVVGHPNKGKSSVVATLAQDDRIAISAKSGTTRVAEERLITVGGSSYGLIDTPGFQRPSKVLHWLTQHADSAEKRQAAVKLFLHDPQCQKDFPDEIQLLSPIIEGAAILYVVDGSRPYGSEYEAEMEILRWTGQASMALINPIESNDYVEQWQQALAQYFKVVKVFNAMQANFDKQLSVLEAFSHLHESWRESIDAIVREQRSREQQKSTTALALLTQLLTSACRFQVSQKALSGDQARSLAPILDKRFRFEMQKLESQCHEELAQLYNYHDLQTDISELNLDGELFDTEKWVAWGLNRKQLTIAAAMAGAATGAVVDLSLAGSSLFLGALGGGLLAGGGAWLSSDRLADFKLKGLPLGGFEAHQGPVKNRNFPYVLIGRFLLLHHALTHRTHAQRDTITLDDNAHNNIELPISSGPLSLPITAKLSERLSALSKKQQQELHRSLDKLHRQKPVDNLSAALHPLLN